MITVNLYSGINVGLEDVVTALATTGIGEANLTQVSTNNLGPVSASPGLVWSFTLSVPFASLGATFAKLFLLEQGLQQNGIGLTLEFSISGTQSSSLSGTRQCPWADLLADASSQAQKVASVAGLKVQ